jgi:hypothetical protein
MNTLTKNKPVIATKLWFYENKLVVLLEDGRELAVPLEWFPKLRDAEQKDLLNWRWIENGMAFTGSR